MVQESESDSPYLPGVPSPVAVDALTPPPLIPADVPLPSSPSVVRSAEPNLTEPSPRRVRFGLLLGLISLPRPINIEVFVKISDLLGIGATYSVFPRALGDWVLSLAGAKNKSIESTAWDLDMRVFPFRGTFFVGISLGHQNITASADTSAGTLTGDVSTVYITPRFGWLWMWQSGITLGFDAGVQLPLSYDYTLTPPLITSHYVDDAAKYAGETPLPSVNFRIGYLF